MEKNRKQQIIIGLIIFISIILVISIAVLVNKKTDTSVNKEVTSLQPTKDSESEPIVKQGIYGLESLDSTKLTTVQKTHFEVELKEFIAAYTGENLSFITLNKDTLKTSYNSARSANEVRFDIKSNSNTVYSVSGLYVSLNDMYVTVYDKNNTVVYFEPYDAGGE